MSRTAKQAHRTLAMFLGIFVAIHFTAHLAALDSIAAHKSVLDLGRAIYRILPIEIALLAAFAVQIVLGLQLLRIIAKRVRKGFWHYAQFTSGVILAVFITAHSSAAIIARWQFDLDTNFYWAAGSLTVSPLKYGFFPYYFLAVTAFFTHLLAALHFRKARPWQPYALALGPAAAILMMLGYSGALHTVVLPEPHQDYFAYYLP